jgi:electron transfer flavoprotein beta subunit
VVIVSFASPSAKERLIKGLAMGADRGLIVDNTGLETLDSLAIAKILAAVIKAEAPNLVLTGKQGIDDDNMHIMSMVAELLDWPHVNVINKLQVDGASAVVERSVEGGQVEVYKVQMPAIFGADKALNNPRYASLPGIMKAKKKPFDVKPPSAFGIQPGKSGVQVVDFQFPAEKPPGKIFQGESVDAMVQKVVKALREEAKVI